MSTRPLHFETMAEHWDDYAERILSPLGLRPADTQSVETRRAFYQGAHTMLAMVKEISDRYPEAEACAKLSALELEFRAFEQDLRNGRA